MAVFAPGTRPARGDLGRFGLFLCKDDSCRAGRRTFSRCFPQLARTADVCPRAVYTPTCHPRLSTAHCTVHCQGLLSAKMPRKPLRIIPVQNSLGQCTHPPAFHGSLRHIALYTAHATFLQICHSSHSASLSSKTLSGSVHTHLPSTALHGTLHCTLPRPPFGSPEKFFVGRMFIDHRCDGKSSGTV